MIKPEKTIRISSQFCTRNVRDGWFTTWCQYNMGRPVLFTTYNQSVGIGKATHPLNMFNIQALQVTIIKFMDITDILISCFNQSIPVKTIISNIKSIIASKFNRFGNLGCKPHGLLGYTANIYTGTT